MKTRKRGFYLITIGLVLIVAALGLVAYNLFKDYRAAQLNRDALEEMLPVIEEGRDRAGVSDIPEYLINPNMPMPAKKIKGLYYVGVLRIPSLKLKLPIVRKWSYDSLIVAPGVYYGSAYKNRFIIAAHNYISHFGNLKNLKENAKVTFTDMDGNVFKYRVSEIVIFDPYQNDDLIESDWPLTLFTCTLGGGSRVVVHCRPNKN